MKVVIVGHAGSGKDTVADYLVAKYGFKKYAFADKLKEIASEMFPELVEKERRRVLQVLGQKLREIEPAVWIDFLMGRIEREGAARVVITDCRYLNEFERCISSGFGPLFIDCPAEIRRLRLLKRDGVPISESEEQHASEREVRLIMSKISKDCFITNVGTLRDLYFKIDKFIGGVLVSEPVESICC
ncbi:MAG: ATP-binding protein [Bacillota bacterium]